MQNKIIAKLPFSTHSAHINITGWSWSDDIIFAWWLRNTCTSYPAFLTRSQLSEEKNKKCWIFWNQWRHEKANFMLTVPRTRKMLILSSCFWNWCLLPGWIDAFLAFALNHVVSVLLESLPSCPHLNWIWDVPTPISIDQLDRDSFLFLLDACISTWQLFRCQIASNMICRLSGTGREMRNKLVGLQE